MVSKKIIDRLLEPRPIIHITKPKYPNYSLAIFTGVITIIMFQIIMYNFMRNIPVSLGERIATFACLIIFIIFSWCNFSDENKNNGSV